MDEFGKENPWRDDHVKACREAWILITIKELEFLAHRTGVTPNYLAREWVSHLDSAVRQLEQGHPD